VLNATRRTARVSSDVSPRIQMNMNTVITTGFSNPESEAIYRSSWGSEGALYEQYRNGMQCGGCSFFAPFNEDYGLCCNRKACHHTETVFEHFTCESFVREGWGPHSFSEHSEFHCKCDGKTVYETMNDIIILLDGPSLDPEVRSHLRELRKYVENRDDG